MYKPIIPILEKLLQESGTNNIIDLGSSGGGGLLWLGEEMNALVDSLDNKDKFNWEIKRIKSRPGVILYLSGTPRSNN